MAENAPKIHKITRLAPPAGLLDRVLSRVEQEKRLARLKRRFLFSLAAFFVSLTICLPLAGWLFKEFRQSGFFEYLTLIYTDFYVVMSYWQDFCLTILETLPAMALIAVFAVSLSMAASGRALLNSINELKKITHLNFN